jgi:prevent-host-death family protein
MTPPAPIPAEDATVEYPLFRESPATYMAQARETHRPVRVTFEGQPPSVLLDAGDFDALRDTLGLLRDVARGEQDRLAGRVVPQNEARRRILERFAE